MRGVTTAALKASGTQPFLREQLTSCVSDGSSISIHSLIRNVGQGSSRQDFVGELLTILSTSSSETCLKTVILEDLRVNLIYGIRGRKIVSNILNFVQKRRQTGQPMTF